MTTAKQQLNTSTEPAVETETTEVKNETKAPKKKTAKPAAPKKEKVKKPTKVKAAKVAKTAKKKRIHKREFHMAVNQKGGAIANKKQLPVFWKKSDTKKAAGKNSKVVRVTMTW